MRRFVGDSHRGDRVVATLGQTYGKIKHVTKFWAENGLVYWEQEKPDGTLKRGTEVWQNMARVVLHFSENLDELLIQKYKHQQDAGFAEEYERTRKWIAEMLTVLRTARAQGGPVERDLIPRPDVHRDILVTNTRTGKTEVRKAPQYKAKPRVEEVLQGL